MRNIEAIPRVRKYLAPVMALSLLLGGCQRAESASPISEAEQAAAPDLSSRYRQQQIGNLTLISYAADSIRVLGPKDEAHDNDMRRLMQEYWCPHTGNLVQRKLIDPIARGIKYDESVMQEFYNFDSRIPDSTCADGHIELHEIRP